MIFSPSEFMPTKWETAKDKAAFANRFVQLRPERLCRQALHREILSAVVEYVRAYRSFQPGRVLGDIFYDDRRQGSVRK